MQHVNIGAVLDALVTLTGEREPRALDLHYCQAVAALLSPRGICVAQARKSRGAWTWKGEARRSNDVASKAGLPVPEITADFVASFQSRAPFQAPSDCSAGKLLVVPLDASDKRLLGLLVEHEDLGPHQAQVVAQTLSVYRNHHRLLTDSQTDTLTGLLNRKTFDEKIGGLLQASRGEGPQGGRRACLAVLDIDHFKRINDRLGHLYGDEVLLLFSRLMRECFRDNDLLFRFGGEEFVVVLHDIDRSQAASVFERFRRKLEGRAFPQVGTVTVSTGFVAIGAQDLPSTIIQQADAALYHAKHTGRNRVCCHEELIAAGDLSTVQFESELTLF